MSVALCVLRFEIAEGFPVLPHIYYTAPGKTMSEKPKSEVSSETLQKHRGHRRMYDITVQTISTDGPSEPSSEQPGSSGSKEPTPEPSRPTPRRSIGFFSGNPFVEVTKGVLHLFKENELTSLTAEVGRSEMLCILAVPAAMTTHDLLQFTAPCSEGISHVRIIRDSTPNQYMVLLRFRSQSLADQFYKEYNGTRFNSIEPEECHLVYVSKVEASKESDAGCLPLEGHTELPTCPVCLERMDESVDGILTILCNHTFHGGCLAKWGDTTCPICRYCQSPEAVADNWCSECHGHDSLWICLICGHVGCGRYVEGHAYQHFLETQHTYAMQLGENRVWDYAGDNYVHRLIQNKGDGKLVEYNESTTVEQDEKLDSIQLEYTYLLTSQLESQRLYFESRLARIEKDARTQIDEISQEAKKMSLQCGELKEKLVSTMREKVALEKKLAQTSAKLAKTTTDLKEETQN